MNLWSADSEQNWYKYVVDLFRAMKQYKASNPSITEAYLFTDGAPNLTGAPVLLMMMEAEAYTGIRILELNNNEGGEGKQILDTYFSHLKAKAEISKIWFRNWDDVPSLVELFNFRGGAQGGTSMQLEPDRSVEPPAKKNVGKAMKDRSTYLCTVFNYTAASNIAVSITSFENAHIGVGRRTVYADVKNSIETQDAAGQTTWSEFRKMLPDMIEPKDTDSAQLTSRLQPLEKPSKGAWGGSKKKPPVAESSLAPIFEKPRKKYKKRKRSVSSFVTKLHVCQRCGTTFTLHKRFLKHVSTNLCSSKNTVVRPVSGTDADAVLNGAAAAAMTTTSFVAAIRFPARHIVLQGESRNVYREQQQFFSKDATAQLIQWFHDGNDNKTKKVGHRVPDKDRAQSLINLGYEQRPSDLTDDVFLKKLVKRVKQWFVSYSAKSKKRTSNSYLASATEVVHQLMPADVIESTVAAKGDAPSGQERDAATASTASTDLDVATAASCPKKSKPRIPKPNVMPTIAKPIAKTASTSTSSRPYRKKFPNSRFGGFLCHSGKRNLK